MRYGQLLNFVREAKPKAIVEIGTWNGDRAQQMLNLAPEGCKYYGFDLFEDATVETDREEMNVKAHHFLDSVYDKLSAWDVKLFKGNTRETLKWFKPDEKIDFVWLDGGHSIETIKSDWEHLKPHLVDNAYVFFDDYYTGTIDTSKFGCNEIVKDLKHEVLPEKDHVKGGGWVQMVRVWP